MGTQWGLAGLDDPHLRLKASSYNPPAIQQPSNGQASLALWHWDSLDASASIRVAASYRKPLALLWTSVWTWGIDPQNSCGKIIINQAIWECPIFRKKTIQDLCWWSHNLKIKICRCAFQSLKHETTSSESVLNARMSLFLSDHLWVSNRPSKPNHTVHVSHMYYVPTFW